SAAQISTLSFSTVAVGWRERPTIAGPADLTLSEESRILIDSGSDSQYLRGVVERGVAGRQRGRLSRGGYGGGADGMLRRERFVPVAPIGIASRTPLRADESE
ncbi:MAG TPA: hypothetical protein VKB50_24580, partial [Vicinamibacterales bacterium]|nr:hypothetical protein [Vicinamibacterales bacterium]